MEIDMPRTFLPLLLAASPTLLWSATPVIQLSGTVTRTTGGTALSGVALSLVGQTSTATSGTDGKFRISNVSTGLRGLHSPARPLDLSVESRDLVVASAMGAGAGRIEAYTMDGTRILETGLEGTSLRIPASRLAPGLNRLVIRMDGSVQEARVLRIHDGLVLDRSASSSGSALARTAAAAVDTLVASKTGFVSKRTPVAAYVDSNLAITLDSSTSTTCPTPVAGTSKSNPIFTDVYTADPAVMVDNCTFYIQCGHDQGTTGFDLREWYLLKSTDMVTWTRTTPMNLKTFAWTNANAWAGQMIHAKNGKYYWYVPINDIVHSQDRMAIGVAVADSPEGPWKDALGKPLVDDSLEMATWNITNIDQTPHTIDPTVFIDDDGQAYFQYGGFWTMVSAKLNPDMISFAGPLTKTTPLDYFESPYLVKRNNIYYEIYAHGAANPTTIDYATSSSPMGPWTHKGTILDTMPRVAGQDAPTNHAGVGLFAGQWYIVYHVSNGPNGGGTYKREVAIDKLNFNTDGTIQKVTPSSALKF
jgi:hypothetical protein